MKNLYNLYKKNINIKDVKTNSKEITNNDLFACIKGVEEDRHKYIDEAINNGASLLIVSKQGNYNIPFVKVKNVEKELVRVLKYVYNDYSKINLIGVTGTDGKTTTATIIKYLLDDCSYIGTNGIISKSINEDLNNTTPSIEKTYYYLDKLAKDKTKYVSIEASSEGLLHKRLNGLLFKRAIITNITEDHLNVHKTIENYINCKKLLFKQLDKDGVAILNRDDKYYDKFKSIKRKKYTYGFNRYSTLRIIDYKLNSDSTIIKYKYNKKYYVIKSPLLGLFNIYNLSAVILTMLSLNYNFDYINKKIKNIKTIKGRVEFLNYNTNYKIVIDYAHTENGIKEILTYLNSIKKGRIITVTGAAGGREKENRKKKGIVLQSLSDLVIYTMDDPRYEKVSDIINMMIDNNRSNYVIEENREVAISKALSMAGKDDIVAILGKGRDTYMAIEDKKVYYSDIDVINKYFEKL